jgi:hypothetical protein
MSERSSRARDEIDWWPKWLGKGRIRLHLDIHLLFLRSRLQFGVDVLRIDNCMSTWHELLYMFVRTVARIQLELHCCQDTAERAENGLS